MYKLHRFEFEQNKKPMIMYFALAVAQLLFNLSSMYIKYAFGEHEPHSDMGNLIYYCVLEKDEYLSAY